MLHNYFTPKRILLGAGVLALAVVIWFFLPGGVQKKDPDKDRGHESQQHESDDHDARKPEGRKSGGKKKHEDHKDEAREPGQVKLSPEAATRANLKVEPASAGPMAEKVQLTGELVFNEEKMARVSSRIAGRVVKIVADYGAAVRQGDVLAVMDSVELGQAQAAFLQSVAGYNLAQKAFERARLLWQEKAISQAEFLERKAKLELAQAERDYGENRLHLLGLNDADIGRMFRPKQRKGPGYHAGVESTFSLRSPISGQVVDRKATPGLVVKPDEELFTVADISTLWCFVQTPEKDLPLVKTGSPVTIRVSSLPQEDFAGTIDYVAAMVEKATRMTRARVRVENSKGELKAGMFATILVTSGTRTALNIPETAVLAAGSEQYVFIEQGPGSYLKRSIKAGLKGDGRVEVLEGLKEGERVVVQGAFTLKSELEKEALEAE
ncbi:MAG: efflux RND transporter periplasmic adaptor subunit [Deltaproteobacteria bacterium]|nr:efflux RND transporter periplasmic adaptor subunit [Deltaproteobacteria bacterium]